jgi:hypothetical protein
MALILLGEVLGMVHGQLLEAELGVVAVGVCGLRETVVAVLLWSADGVVREMQRWAALTMTAKGEMMQWGQLVS